MSDAFWTWFTDEAARLRTLGADALSQAIGAALAPHAAGLGVEVTPADEVEPDVEILFTARRERLHFASARALVAGAPRLQGFRFVALRPPQDFDVVLESDGVELDGAALTFEPLLGPAGVGLRLFIPDHAVGAPELRDLLWLLLETGLGEEVASGVSHLELAPTSAPEAADALPLTELSRFLHPPASRTG